MIGVIALIGVIGSYALWQSRLFLEGPVIAIEAPADGSSITPTVTTLTGSVKNVSYITLNGRQIYADTEGNIDEPLVLPEGYNIVQVSGRDKFGRETTKTIQLVAREPDTQSSAEIVQDSTRTRTTN